MSAAVLGSSLRSARLRLLAGRPRLVPAGVHQDDRRADVREQHADVRSGEAHHREGPIGVHRPRASTRSSPTRTASTRLLTGEISSITVTPAAFTEDRQASTLCHHGHDEDRVQGREGGQGAVVEPVPAVPRGLRALQHRRTSPIRPLFSARTSTRSTGSPPSSPARIVSAILEAF